jgi:hypothetical protein
MSDFARYPFATGAMHFSVTLSIFNCVPGGAYLELLKSVHIKGRSSAFT